MQANYVQRVRLSFRKFGPTRYIGHLDLARTLERALNRAEIPVSYSQGFNRRPRMSLVAALPLGYTSECELVDIYLTTPLPPEVVRQQVMSRMAPGIEVYQAVEIPLNAPALQTLTTDATYLVTLLDAVDTAVLQQRLTDLLAAPTLPRVREQKEKQKPYDLRPLILDIQLLPSTPAALPQLTMTLCLEASRSGRPDEVLLALQLDPLATRIHRTHISFAPGH